MDGLAARLKSSADMKPLVNLIVFALPHGVGALEVIDAVFMEDQEAGGYFSDEVNKKRGHGDSRPPGTGGLACP